MKRKGYKREAGEEERKTGAMKKSTLFLAGLGLGVYVAHKWRNLAKEGMKLGIQAGQKLNEISQQAREEIEDVAAEATAELAEQAESGNKKASKSAKKSEGASDTPTQQDVH